MWALFKGETRIGNTRPRASDCFEDARLHHGLVQIHGDAQVLNGVSPTMSDKDGSWGLLAGFSIRDVSIAKAQKEETTDEIEALRKRIAWLEGLFDFSDPEIVLHHAPNDPVTKDAVVVLRTHYETKR